MTIIFSVVISFVIFGIASILWQLLCILTGVLESISVVLMAVFLLTGLIMSITNILSILKRRSYHNVLGISVLTLVTAVPVYWVFPQGSPGLYVNLVLSIVFAMISIKTIFKHLSLIQTVDIYTMISRFFRVLGLLIFVSIIFLPLYFMIFLSITPRAVFLQNPANLMPRFSLGKFFDGYVEVMTTFKFGRYILNSLLVSLSTVVLTMIPATLGAYAVTRLRFPGQKFLSRSILIIYMFPSIVLAIPLYSVFSSLGLRDSLLGLLIVYPAITIPVSLYMLRNYFQTLPREIEEAGIIDGCSRLSVIRYIVLPLSIPALLAVGLYIFMIAWNEFLFAFMFLDKQSIFTLSRGMVSLNSQEVPRQYLMAGAIIITLPVMLIFFSLERFFTGGLVAGGVKG